MSVDGSLPVALRNEGHETLMNVWWTSVALRKEARRFFRVYGLSDAKFNVLILLAYSEAPLTQVEVGRRLLVDKSNVTGLLDRMAADGLLERRRVSGDRRSRHVVLTEKGLSILREVEGPYMRRVEKVVSSLSGSERESLGVLMAKIRRGLEEAEAEPVVVEG